MRNKPLTYLRFSSSLSCSARSKVTDWAAVEAFGAVRVVIGVPLDDVCVEVAFFRGEGTGLLLDKASVGCAGTGDTAIVGKLFTCSRCFEDRN